MNQDDLYASRGPVSSMPGSGHSLPPGTKCDQHEDRDAVSRIQGETDSFGCEYVMMCQECVDAHREYRKAEYEKEKFCDWCKCMKTNVRSHRDMDEGMAGPLYDVCSDCRSKENERLLRELEESRSRYGDYDDLIDDDIGVNDDEFDDHRDDEPHVDDEWNNGEGQGPDLYHDPASDDEARLATYFAAPVQRPAPIITYKRARRLER